MSVKWGRRAVARTPGPGDSQSAAAPARPANIAAERFMATPVYNYNTGDEWLKRVSEKSKSVAAVWCLLLVFTPRAGAQESPLRRAARLDEERKCGEAEPFYQQALAQGSPSLALLNNLGNHYLLCGDQEKARGYFERLVKLNPQHANANLQLARIAADHHEGGRSNTWRM